MSIEDELREMLGSLHSKFAPQPIGNVVPAAGNLGARDTDGRLNGLENDVRKLHDALLKLAHEVARGAS